MNPVYIIDAVRTAIGKYGGALSSVRPDDLLATTIKALLARNASIDANTIEEVITGAANQSGEDNRNVARMAALLAGLPTTVAGVTVNRLCASGLQSIMDAARAINNGDGDLYIASGVESMTRAPFVMAKSSEAWSRTPEVFDTTMGWRFVNKNLSALYYPYTMGETAENVAKQYHITRAAQDAFALHSQEKYTAAKAENAFANEIIPIEVMDKKDSIQFNTDEHPRLSSLEKLSQLKPAFVKDGTVTAGNSSGINDGAAAMLVASDKYITANNIKPIAKIIAMAVAGVDPSIMGIGPVPAVQKALQRAALKIQDIGLWELNEAFASQSLACIQELQLDAAKVNVNGGAIALGHPLGCSGTRISTTLIYAMQKRKIQYGVATMCVGVGQGAAVVYELG
jgi:acetyl-CoA C-acetyltransferase